MANVEEEVAKIASAKYGRDVRSSICSAILAMNDESSEAISKADTAQDSASASAQSALDSKNAAKTSENNAKEYADEAKAAVTGIYHFKGSVQTRDDLPATPSAGDVYDIISEGGMNVAWTGTKWDELGATVDLSAYLTKTDASSTYLSKTDAGTSYATKTELAGKGDNMTYDENSSTLLLKSGSTILSSVHIEGGSIATIVHIDTHETSWFNNPNVTIDVNDGEEDIDNGHFDENGDYIVRIHYLGTYTVTVTDENGVEYVTTFEDVTLGSVMYVFIEPYGYKTWLTKGRVTTEYSSLADVLADEKTVRQLMTIHDSVDYLVEWMDANDTVADTFLASENALKWIGLRDYAYDNMPSEFITEWLDGDNWEYALKDKVPVMTSNSAPYGEVSYSNNKSGYDGYCVFDGNSSTHYETYGGTESNAYISYKFTNPICVKKVGYGFESGTVTRSATFKIQASNDGSNWTDLTEYIATSESGNTDVSNNNYYLYYRVYVNATTVHRIGIDLLQFYGRSLNVSVPTMTSNNAPYGEVSASSKYSIDDESAPFKAFNGIPTYWGWVPTESNGWISYDFKRTIALKMIAISNVCASTSYNKDDTRNISIEGYDGEKWNTVKETFSFTYNLAYNPRISYAFIDSNNKYSKYRVTGLGGDANGWKLQFYGLDYSEREFETGSTIKYLYDHGVEFEDIALLSTISSTVYEKQNSRIYFKQTASSNSVRAQTVNNIDMSKYSLIRAITDSEITNVSNAFIYAGTSTAYKAITNDIPYNCSLDISNVSGQLDTHIQLQGTGGILTFNEWWLE